MNTKLSKEKDVFECFICLTMFYGSWNEIIKSIGINIKICDLCLKELKKDKF